MTFGEGPVGGAARTGRALVTSESGVGAMTETEAATSSTTLAGAAPAGLQPYPMDNDNPHSVVQHDSLAALLDPETTTRIEQLCDLAGARCLEIGAGAGSIAVWLADRVGPTGSVTATDLKPQQIPARPQLTVLRHDLLTDPIPPGPFDLIHARLVLMHLPQRIEILHRLTQSLADGGVLLIEDWDTATTGEVLAAASEEAFALRAACRDAIRQVYAAHGTDGTWARRIHSAMVAEGLANVETVVSGRSWTGGGPGCRVMTSSLDQMRDALLAVGMTERQHTELRQAYADPEFVISGFLLYSTSGRRRRS